MRISHWFSFTVAFAIVVTGCSLSITKPNIINHPPPSYGVNEKEELAVFAEQGGCSKASNTETYICEVGSPLNAIGCEKLTAVVFPGLDPYPVIECIWEWSDNLNKTPPNGFENRCGACDWLTASVTFDGNEFRTIKSADEYKELFVPIDSPNEALDFILATTDYGNIYDIQYEKEYQYHTKQIESTYVKLTDEGYLIHLFENDISKFDEKDCQATVYATNLTITPSGEIKILEPSHVPMYTYQDEYRCLTP